MSKTILCADDSATMQKVAEITFGGSDYKYVGAKSADEALRVAKSERPALILADAIMPGKTGYDLCKAIKSDPDLASIPVLLMCGNSQAYDNARGEQCGADGHVVKPWDTQVMLDKLGETLSRIATDGVARLGAGAIFPATFSRASSSLARAKAPTAMATSRAATSKYRPVESRFSAMRISHAEATYAPMRVQRVSTASPTMISMTPAIRMKLEPLIGSTRWATGLR